MNIARPTKKKKKTDSTPFEDIVTMAPAEPQVVVLRNNNNNNDAKGGRKTMPKQVSFSDIRLTSDTYTKVPPGEKFEVPKEILEKPQYIFGYHVAVLYDSEDQCRAELADAFGVSKQAIWLWRRQGMPAARIPQLEQVIQEGKTKLRLASNVTASDMTRPNVKKMAGEHIVNEDWLNFLRDVETDKYEGCSRDDIAELADIVNVSPSTIYRWGWVTGGVVKTHTDRVWEFWISKGMHHNFKLSREDFIKYCEKHFAG